MIKQRVFFLLIRGFPALLRRLSMWVSTLLHRLALVSVQPGSRFQWGSRLLFRGTTKVGRDCLFWGGVEVSSDFAGAELLIGDRVHVNRNVHLDVSGGLEIGDDVVISEDAIIYTHDHGLSPHALPLLLRKEIGVGAWIGARVIVLAGCRKIGRKAVIGAGAVVVRDVPDNAVVVGNPARVVRIRSLEEIE